MVVKLFHGIFSVLAILTVVGSILVMFKTKSKEDYGEITAEKRVFIDLSFIGAMIIMLGVLYFTVNEASVFAPIIALHIVIFGVRIFFYIKSRKDN